MAFSAVLVLTACLSQQCLAGDDALACSIAAARSGEAGGARGLIQGSALDALTALPDGIAVLAELSLIVPSTFRTPRAEERAAGRVTRSRPARPDTAGAAAGGAEIAATAVTADTVRAKARGAVDVASTRRPEHGSDRLHQPEVAARRRAALLGGRSDRGRDPSRAGNAGVLSGARHVCLVSEVAFLAQACREEHREHRELPPGRAASSHGTPPAGPFWRPERREPIKRGATRTSPKTPSHLNLPGYGAGAAVRLGTHIAPHPCDGTP